MSHLYTWVTRGAEILLTFVIGLIILLSMFLYQSYYQSVTFTQRIVDLRQVVARIEIDEATVKKVMAQLEAQRTLPALDPKKIPNPFK